MNNYFCKDFHADSYLMYDYLSQLEMYTGNERSGDKFFTKQKGSKQSNSFKFGWTWRKRRGVGEREYDVKSKIGEFGSLNKSELSIDNFRIKERCW